MKNKKIPKEIKQILKDKHDSDLEFVEECLYEHQNENAENVLEKVNIIRKFLGNKKLNIIDMKKDMILEKLK